MSRIWRRMRNRPVYQQVKTEMRYQSTMQIMSQVSDRLRHQIRDRMEEITPDRRSHVRFQIYEQILEEL